MDLTTVLERNPKMMAADMDGETVMMHIDRGSYFALNAVGSHVWALLEEPRTLGAIVESVQDSFDTGDSEDVTDDITAFTRQLVENDLIRVAKR
jgi:hypothetical protein